MLCSPLPERHLVVPQIGRNRSRTSSGGPLETRSLGRGDGTDALGEFLGDKGLWEGGGAEMCPPSGEWRGVGGGGWGAEG